MSHIIDKKQGWFSRNVEDNPLINPIATYEWVKRGGKSEANVLREKELGDQLANRDTENQSLRDAIEGQMGTMDSASKSMMATDSKKSMILKGIIGVVVLGGLGVGIRYFLKARNKGK